jgi:hypothetical protein
MGQVSLLAEDLARPVKTSLAKVSSGPLAQYTLLGDPRTIIKDLSRYIAIVKNDIMLLAHR